MIWGIAQYEMRMQVRSLVFWLALVLVGLMFHSEVYQEPHNTIVTAKRYAENPEEFLKHWQDPAMAKARYEPVAQNGIDSRAAAAVFGDRMQIVFVFAALFTAGFMFERDRLTKAAEPLQARPIPPWVYAAGKMLGAALPLLAATLVAMVAAMAVHGYANSLIDKPYSVAPFLQSWALLLAPTVLYATALAGALSLLLQRAAVVVPVYLAYMMGGGVVPLGGGFRLDLTTFIVRAEGRQGTLLGESLLGTVLVNRGFYLTLTVALVALAGWLWSHRRGDAR